MPAPPLKSNKSSTTTTTTKMFADIVQKTQTKPPFDNRNFSFPKICNQKKLKKNLQNLQKICIQAEEERKQINFFSKK